MHMLKDPQVKVVRFNITVHTGLNTRFIFAQDADQTVNTFFDLFAYRMRNSLIQHAMITTRLFLFFWF